MKASRNVRSIVTALVVAGLVLLPVYSALSGNVFVLTLFTRIVILALAATSLNLIMGYGGMMSFGHAAYLGIGGYAVGILAHEGIGSGFIQWPVALIATCSFRFPVTAGNRWETATQLPGSARVARWRRATGMRPSSCLRGWPVRQVSPFSCSPPLSFSWRPSFYLPSV